MFEVQRWETFTRWIGWTWTSGWKTQVTHGNVAKAVLAAQALSLGDPIEDVIAQFGDA